MCYMKPIKEERDPLPMVTVLPMFAVTIDKKNRAAEDADRLSEKVLSMGTTRVTLELSQCAAEKLQYRLGYGPNRYAYGPGCA